MDNLIKNSKNTLLLFSILLFCVSSCKSQSGYDPELMTPDNDAAGMNHGFNYTPLGALLAYPWEYEVVVIDSSSNRIVPGSINKTIKELKDEFVFEPQRDGSLKYWFKSDYLINPIDTVILADGNKSISITRLKSKDLKIKKIYTTGKWEANFRDSTIMIDFGKNDFGLNLIKGKYYLLTAENLRIIEEASINSVTEGKKNKSQKKIYSSFVHYKIP